MALAKTNFETKTGGGATGAGPAVAARQVVLLGVSPGGTVNTLYKPSSIAGVRAVSSFGPLAEAGCLVMAADNGPPPPMLVPVNPSAAGGASAVTASDSATGTITVAAAPHVQVIEKCITGGALGTATFQYSLDGGSTWSDIVTSDGSAPWVYRPLGTFLSLSHAAATYVATKTNTYNVDGTLTSSSGWVGTVTRTASPIGTYEARITCVTGGALGIATLSVSLDNGTASGGGATSLPLLATPSSGVVVLPNTGLVITASGTFTAGEYHRFVATPPGYSTSDITSAVTALRADPTAPTGAVLCFFDNPGTYAGAFSAATTLDSALDTAESSEGLDWQGMVNCACTEGALGGDVVYNSGAIRSATTSTNIRTQRLSTSDTDKVSVWVGAHRVASKITGWKLQFTSALIAAIRVAETTPKQGIAARDGKPLSVDVVGRDELTASVAVHDVQVNCLQTIRGEPANAWVAVEAGGLGWRNMTTDGDYQDADSWRVINAGKAAVRPVMNRLIGSRPQTNSNGTIEERQARKWDKLLNGVFQRALGLEEGGAFQEAQVSGGGASVDRSSQLGESPYELIVEFFVQRLGFVSGVRGKLRVFGRQ